MKYSKKTSWPVRCVLAMSLCSGCAQPDMVGDNAPEKAPKTPITMADVTVGRRRIAFFSPGASTGIPNDGKSFTGNLDKRHCSWRRLEDGKWRTRATWLHTLTVKKSGLAFSFCSPGLQTSGDYRLFEKPKPETSFLCFSHMSTIVVIEIDKPHDAVEAVSKRMFAKGRGLCKVENVADKDVQAWRKLSFARQMEACTKACARAVLETSANAWGLDKAPAIIPIPLLLSSNEFVSYGSNKPKPKFIAVRLNCNGIDYFGEGTIVVLHVEKNKKGKLLVDAILPRADYIHRFEQIDRKQWKVVSKTIVTDKKLFELMASGQIVGMLREDTNKEFCAWDSKRIQQKKLQENE